MCVGSAPSAMDEQTQLDMTSGTCLQLGNSLGL